MRRLATVLALALVATGCTRTEYHSGPGRQLPDSLGDCHGPAPAEDHAAALSRPGVWLRVERIGRGNGEPGKVEVKRYLGRYHVVGGDPAMVAALPSTVHVLFARNTTAWAIEEALKHHAVVTVHTGANGNPREVAYALASIDGQPTFVGECANVALRDPVRDRLRADAKRYLDAIVGRPSADVARILAVPPAHAGYLLSDVEGRVIRPGDVPPGLLAAYRTGRLTVRAPDSWDGPARICTRVELGRGECVTLRGRRTTTAGVRLWYDPADPVVDVVLVHATHGFEVAVLATADVARDGVRLRVDLAASPSLAEVLADPSLAPRAVASLRVSPST